MGQRRPPAATTATGTSESAVQQCPNGNGAAEPQQLASSEKSPISALIQKFSSSSASSNNNNNNNTNSNSDSVPSSVKMSRKASKSAVESVVKVVNDELDCAAPLAAAASELCVVRVKESPSNKLSVHDSHQPQGLVQQRKGSESGQLKGLLLTAEEKNGGPRVMTNSNGGHQNIYNSARKLSADFRLGHFLGCPAMGGMDGDNGKLYSTKPARVKNLANRTEAYDMLHHKTVERVSEGVDLRWG